MSKRSSLLAAILTGTVAAAAAWAASAVLWRLATPRWPGVEGAAQLAKLGREAELRSYNHASFESGNIGEINRTGAHAYTLQLRSDNDDALPKFWRQWFYLKVDDVPTDAPVTFTLEGAGQWSYYLPFFSYDDKTWYQFDPGEVTQPSRFVLSFSHKFRRGPVWLARYVPYTYTTLQAYLGKIKRHPDVLVSEMGHSPQGRPVPLVTITDRSTERIPARGEPKRRVVIHARTHPGEVGSSFLLEGLVDFLLSRDPLARRLREKLIFTIVPMLNVDGVVAGNNRVSPQGVNLEGKWYPGSTPLAIDDAKAPPEVRLFHDRLVALLRDATPVTMALNLHASAGEPNDSVFIFPHFGPEPRGYRAEEARLYGKQVDFIHDLCAVQGKSWFNTPPEDGTRAFLSKSIPETWWWRNFQDQVTALTIESTYGLAGGSKRWVKPDDMRRLGVSMARAIARFQGLGGERVAH